MLTHLFFASILVVVLLVIFLLLRKKNIRIRRSLLGNKEELIIEELEDNIDEKITGLKNKLEDYKKELHEDSFKKVIENIDNTFDEVKSLSKKVINDTAESAIVEQSLLDIVEEKKSKLNITVSVFPDNYWGEIKRETRKIIFDLSNNAINFISGKYKDINVSIQLVYHTDYINLLIEAENISIAKEDFNSVTNFESILERVKGKYEIDNIQGSGAIINVSIQDIESIGDGENLKRIKVIIAEDHDVSLFGLLSLFKTRKDIEVVGTAKNGMEVLKILETKNTDIVITDISMPGMDGIELSAKLQNDYPDIKVIVFTMYMENWFIEQLINSGAKGFVSKNSKIVELVGALHAVNEGDNYYCPQFKSKFGFKGNGYGSTRKLDSLTKNELLIVKYYAEGLNKPQIAEKMLVSHKTIDTFLANILLKLNAGDEEEIIYVAKKQKLISD